MSEGSGSEHSAASSSASSPVPCEKEEHQCPRCEKKLSQPKVLSCLHVFCLGCLQSQLQEEEEEAEDKQNARDGEKHPPGVITCSTCKQETPIPPQGLEDLMTEHVLVDQMELLAIEDLVCTSCKAKEKAVARCVDCDSFLCSNCVTAHQFMRCFDNHMVVSFKDLKSGEAMPIHKPIYCRSHPAESLKYFCHPCSVAVCKDCLLGDHKPPNHFTSSIADLEEGQKKALEKLVEESKVKVEECNHKSSVLENSLSDLQMQRDSVKSLIQETFQSYKAVLEKKRDSLLAELEKLHSHQELAIMDMCHLVERTSEKMEDGVAFTQRLLEHGNGLHLTLMQDMVARQLQSLIKNTPNAEIRSEMEFHTDADIFKKAIDTTFGSLCKEEPKVEERPSSSLQSSFDSEQFQAMKPILPMDKLNQTIVPQVPADFLVSPDEALKADTLGDAVLSGIAVLHGPTGGLMGTGLTGPIAHNMHEVERTNSQTHSPTMSDSGISVDNASNNSASSAPMLNNIQALTNFQPQVLPGSLDSVQPNKNLRYNLFTPTSLQDMPIIDSFVMPPSSVIGSSMGNLTVGINTIASTVSSMNLSPGSNSDTSSVTGSTNFSGSSNSLPPPVRRNKMSAMQIRCKFGQLGPGKAQFNSPHGFCLGLEEDIIVADTNNHRVQVFEKTGEFKYQFGIPGREEGQLWYPRKIAVLRNSGKFVVCDRGMERSRMQVFTKLGHFVRKIAIRYIDIVAGLAITQQGHIVAVDSVSPTVFCISEAGELIKWFDCSDYMREPSDIAISGKEYFVCDFKGHCVVVFNDDGNFLRRIGCEAITNYPNGIDISDAGDVLVGDSHGNRFHVAVFQRDGSLIGEFECPYVKVSRCCGLKITSEGYVVTLAKNNHHVLVLNTLYIT